MSQIDLSPEESEAYRKVVSDGNMDDMFELGYVIGRARLAQEQLEMLKKDTSEDYKRELTD